MRKLIKWLHDRHLHHPALSLIPLSIGVIVDAPWSGAMFATGFYYGREITHASLPPGSGVWWRGFDFRNWSRDNHLDFWPVLILSVLVASLATWSKI